MNTDEIEITCNVCQANKFWVIKPTQDLDKTHWYYTCTDCNYFKGQQRRLEHDSKYGYYMKTGILPNVEKDNPYEDKGMPIMKPEDNPILQTEYRIAAGLKKMFKKMDDLESASK